MSTIKTLLAQTLFPAFCYGCKRSNTYFCQDCRETTNTLSHALCPHCKARLPFGKLLNKECLDALRLKRIFSCAEYEDKLINSLIKDLKYKRAHALAKPLAEYTYWWLQKTENLNEVKQNIDLIVPVPMHKSKEKERGFNPAQKLAQEFSKLTNIPVADDLLFKTHKTKPQTETKNKEERQKNLKNAFALRQAQDSALRQAQDSALRQAQDSALRQAQDSALSPPPTTGLSESPVVGGKKVLLIDDVATTGSTLRECAIALQYPHRNSRKKCAKEVWALTIAQD